MNRLAGSVSMAALAAAVAGCLGSGLPISNAVDGGDLGTGCRGTLTGAVTETIVGCKVTWTEMAGLSGVGTDGHTAVSDEARIDNLGFIFRVHGDPVTGAYTMSNVLGFGAGVDVKTPAGVRGYTAFYSTPVAGDPPPPPTIGSLSATIDSFVVDFVNASTSQWIVRGRATATLKPAPGSSSMGTVEMSIEF